MIRLASKEFIPVSGDDWYQRRRNDSEGEFFRKVADQGPRKGKGGGTRQGIYCFTASGKLLAYKNAQDARVMRETIESPVIEHFRVQKILVDRGQLVRQHRVQPRDDSGVAFHLPPCAGFASAR